MFQQRLTTVRVITNADVLLRIPLKTETVAEKSQATDNWVPCINYPQINTISVSQQLMWDAKTTKELALCWLSLHKTVNDFPMLRDKECWLHVPLLAWHLNFRIVHVHPIFSFDCSLNGKISKYLLGWLIKWIVLSSAIDRPYTSLNHKWSDNQSGHFPTFLEKPQASNTINTIKAGLDVTLWCFSLQEGRCNTSYPRQNAFG